MPLQWKSFLQSQESWITLNLNASESNYKNIELHDPGTSVESFLESNPCKFWLAEGRNYFCSYKGGCVQDTDL